MTLLETPTVKASVQTPAHPQTWLTAHAPHLPPARSKPLCEHLPSTPCGQPWGPSSDTGRQEVPPTPTAVPQLTRMGLLWAHWGPFRPQEESASSLALKTPHRQALLSGGWRRGTVPPGSRAGSRANRGKVSQQGTGDEAGISLPVSRVGIEAARFRLQGQLGTLACGPVVWQLRPESKESPGTPPHLSTSLWGPEA